jgi:hypothetical protein
LVLDVGEEEVAPCDGGVEGILASVPARLGDVVMLRVT